MADVRFGDLRLRLAVPYARFGATPGRWETGRDEVKKTAWLDVVLYSGPEKEIRLDELEQAVVVLAVTFSTNDSEAPMPKAEVKEGRLFVSMDTPRLRLSLPVQPGKIAVLQKSFTADSQP